jgi:hypothetical protein
LAQPEPGVLIQKTFLVPEETDFANFYIFLYRRYTFQAATTTLKALIALQTLPSLHTVIPSFRAIHVLWEELRASCFAGCEKTTLANF